MVIDSFLNSFIGEAKTNLEKFEQKIMELEDSPSDFYLISEALRFAHSIKGGASFFEFHNIVNLTHIMESSLETLKDKRIEMTPDMTDVMLLAYDKLAKMINDILNVSKYDTSSEIAQLESVFGELLNSKPGYRSQVQKSEVLNDVVLETEAAMVIEKGIFKDYEDIIRKAIPNFDADAFVKTNHRQLKFPMNKERFNEALRNHEMIYVYKITKSDDINENIFRILTAGEIVYADDFSLDGGNVIFVTNLKLSLLNLILDVERRKLGRLAKADTIENVIKNRAKLQYAVDFKEAEKDRLGVDITTEVTLDDISYRSSEEIYNTCLKEGKLVYKYDYVRVDDLITNITQIIEVGEILSCGNLENSEGTVYFTTPLPLTLLSTIIICDQERLSLIPTLSKVTYAEIVRETKANKDETRLGIDTTTIADLDDYSNITDKEEYEASLKVNKPIFIYEYNELDDKVENISQITEVGQILISDDLNKKYGRVVFTTPLALMLVTQILSCDESRLLEISHSFDEAHKLVLEDISKAPINTASLDDELYTGGFETTDLEELFEKYEINLKQKVLDDYSVRVYQYDITSDNIKLQVAGLVELSDVLINVENSDGKGLLVIQTKVDLEYVCDDFDFPPKSFYEVVVDLAYGGFLRKYLETARKGIDYEKATSSLSVKDDIAINPSISSALLGELSNLRNIVTYYDAINSGHKIFRYHYKNDHNLEHNVLQLAEACNIIITGNLENHTEGVIIFSYMLGIDTLQYLIKADFDSVDDVTGRCYGDILKKADEVNDKYLDEVIIAARETYPPDLASVSNVRNIELFDIARKDGRIILIYQFIEHDNINNTVKELSAIGQVILTPVLASGVAGHIVFTTNVDLNTLVDKLKSNVDRLQLVTDESYDLLVKLVESQKLPKELDNTNYDKFTAVQKAIVKERANIHLNGAPELHKVPESINSIKVKNSRSKQTSDADPKIADDIRVPVELLDGLLSNVNDLVIERNKLNKYINSLEDSGDVVAKIGAKIDTLTRNLQSEVFKTRLQSLETLFSRLPRTIRTVSRQVNKEVDLEVRGGDIELDKNIVDALLDPLTHMIRNALDHGLEAPEERVKLGKPKKGKLIVEASEESGVISIEITDDGKGMDVDEIAKKAIRKGITTEDAVLKMDRFEKIDLIFEPGFSTNDQVTQISGRGVGMDVVRTNISKVNGFIRTRTEVGKGTTFRILIPLSVSVIPIIVYRVADYVLASNAKLIGEYFYNPKLMETLENVDGLDTVVHGNIRMPLLRLGKAFNIKNENEGLYIHVSAKGMHYIMEMDEVMGFEEVLTKGVPKVVKSTRLTSAAILSDGNVAPIIDLYGLGWMFGIRNDSHQILEEKPHCDVEVFLNVEVAGDQSYLINRKDIKNVLLVEPNSFEKYNDKIDVLRKENKFCLPISTLVGNQSIDDNANLVVCLKENPDFTIRVSKLIRDKYIEKEILEKGEEKFGYKEVVLDKVYKILDIDVLIVYICSELGGNVWLK